MWRYGALALAPRGLVGILCVFFPHNLPKSSQMRWGEGRFALRLPFPLNALLLAPRPYHGLHYCRFHMEEEEDEEEDEEDDEDEDEEKKRMMVRRKRSMMRRRKRGRMRTPTY